MHEGHCADGRARNQKETISRVKREASIRPRKRLLISRKLARSEAVVRGKYFARRDSRIFKPEELIATINEPRLVINFTPSLD